MDLMDRNGLEDFFARHRVNPVIHFTGLKVVGESVQLPLSYYHTNITSNLLLCGVMKKFGVHKLVFSSSATVYGQLEQVPIAEASPLEVTNPYGRTKAYAEANITGFSGVV